LPRHIAQFSPDYEILNTDFIFRAAICCHFFSADIGIGEEFSLPIRLRVAFITYRLRQFHFAAPSAAATPHFAPRPPPPRISPCAGEFFAAAAAFAASAVFLPPSKATAFSDYFHAFDISRQAIGFTPPDTLYAIAHTPAPYCQFRFSFISILPPPDILHRYWDGHAAISAITGCHRPATFFDCRLTFSYVISAISLATFKITFAAAIDATLSDCWLSPPCQYGYASFSHIFIQIRLPLFLSRHCFSSRCSQPPPLSLLRHAFFFFFY
jgi:hypothetical protein